MEQQQEQQQHDIGGRYLDHIDITDRPLTYWEYSIHSLLVILAQKIPSLITTDELRRGVEGLESKSYSTWGYYEKWSASMSQILLERGIITQDELDFELLGESKNAIETDHPIYNVGDIIKVKSEDTRTRWRKPHLRCPGYVFNCSGVIEKYIGKFDDPYLLAFRGHGPKQHLYCVSFLLKDLWPEGCDSSNNDKVTLEIYEGWIEPYQGTNINEVNFHFQSEHQHQHDHDHDHHHNHDHDHHHHHDHDHHENEQQHNHDHDHDHDHGHFHESRIQVECNAVDKEGEDTPGKVVGEALIRALLKKGVITEQQLRDTVMKLEGLMTRLAGADLVVKAWMDPEFKARLLENAPLAAKEIEIATSNANAPTILRVVECTPKVHHICVCTLCSCYPSGLLGISPSWYRSRSYRSRTVREPRKVLELFGTHIPSDVEIQVHDSTADCRYMVLPLRPQGTEDWTSEQLRSIITRDSMVGVSIISL